MAKQDNAKLEREYVVPLARHCRHVPRYKKTPKAVRTLKQFLARHMKIRDKDLNKIKIDKYLNEMLWFRGIKKPPAKIKVKAIKEGDIVRVEAVDLMQKIKFKKDRHEKQEKASMENVKKKKQETPAEESQETETVENKEEKTTENKEDTKEKEPAKKVTKKKAVKKTSDSKK